MKEISLRVTNYVFVFICGKNKDIEEFKGDGAVGGKWLWDTIGHNLDEWKSKFEGPDGDYSLFLSLAWRI